MPVGIALLTLSAAVVMSIAFALASRRRRRSTRVFSGALDLDATTSEFPLSAGLKHLGARLNEPMSLGLRLPPRGAHGERRLGALLGLR
jgi:hypothetical protein